MSNRPSLQSEFSQPQVFQIRVKNHLDNQWTDWFSGMSVTLEDDGVTVLTGPVADQAALHGLLKKVRDLGLPLISVNRVETSETHRNRLKKEKE